MSEVQDLEAIKTGEQSFQTDKLFVDIENCQYE